LAAARASTTRGTEEATAGSDAAITVIKKGEETAAEPAVAFSVPLVVAARAAANWDDAH